MTLEEYLSEADEESAEGVRRARAWLSRASEPAIDFWRFVENHGPVEAVRRVRDGSASSDIRALVGVRAGEDKSLADLRRAARCGARLVIPEDDEWPHLAVQALVAAVSEEPERRTDQSERTIAPVPPVALWVRGEGRLDELLERSVAIVGSRASTAYGEHVASVLVYGLAERGWTVVSGGAYGIDAAAHRGALAADGATVAVLSCGVDRPYPSGNGPLMARIADSGGLVVSEFAPGSAAFAHRFLVRNRLIAAFGRGTVVVEAAARSGATATANRARRLGRPVMVVPGPVTSAMSVGCHELLRSEPDERLQRPTLVASTAHVLDTIGRIGDDLADPAPRPEQARDGLSDIALRVLDACPVRVGVSPEKLAAVAGCDVLDVLRVLPALEVADLVQWTGTGWRLTPPPKEERRAVGGGTPLTC
jgi:DNA processing protein